MRNGNISNRAAVGSICFRAEQLLFPRKLINQFSRNNLNKDAYRLYVKLFRDTDFSVCIAAEPRHARVLEKLELFDVNAMLCYDSPADMRIVLDRGDVMYFVGDDKFVAEVHHKSAITLATLEICMRL